MDLAIFVGNAYMLSTNYRTYMSTFLDCFWKVHFKHLGKDEITWCFDDCKIVGGVVVCMTMILS